ncbi:MAG: hypothetical protein ABUS49_03510 [Acidobacteriota bacterium]
MIKIFRISAVLCGTAFLAVAVEPSAPFFENDQVKVFRALEKAHVKGKFHDHKPNRVMIYLQPGQQRFEYQDGRKPAVFEWKAGQVVWSPAEGMHSPEVTGDDAFNIIEVELKKPGSGKALQGKAYLPKNAKVEIENEQVRVVRVKLASHKAARVPAHADNRVKIFLTEQDIRVTDATGQANTVHRKAGEAVWEAPATYTEENLGDKPLEMIVVELKS